MPRSYTAREAAQRLGISLDTLRRWDKTGRISTARDARNRFVGTVSSVEIDGLMAQVEIVVTEPTRVVALVTRDAVEELGLKPGMSATALVKSTSVMVER